MWISITRRPLWRPEPNHWSLHSIGGMMHVQRRAQLARSRAAGVQLPSRHQRRRIRCCRVFLEDERVSQSHGSPDQPVPSRQTAYGRAALGTEDILGMKGALTDAQLQDAITQVIGPGSFRADDEDSMHVQESSADGDDTALRYDDVWAVDDEEPPSGGVETLAYRNRRPATYGGCGVAARNQPPCAVQAAPPLKRHI
jgi:hypothetical protein